MIQTTTLFGSALLELGAVVAKKPQEEFTQVLPICRFKIWGITDQRQMTNITIGHIFCLEMKQPNEPVLQYINSATLTDHILYAHLPRPAAATTVEHRVGRLKKQQQQSEDY